MSKRKDKLKDYRKMNKKEIMKELEEKKEDLRAKKFNLSSGKVKNVKEVEEIKKDIARIKTIINEKNF